MNAHLKLETRLVKRERSYRNVRLGAGFLAFMSMVGALIAIRHEPDDTAFFAGISSQCMFWLALVYASHARIQHVETIKRLRNESSGTGGTA